MRVHVRVLVMGVGGREGDCCRLPLQRQAELLAGLIRCTD